MKRVAIIGTGIAGMACAYELRGSAEITLYEKNDYVGGHTNTVDVDEDGALVPIDTGFMVYNEVTYPNLTRLFKKLNVPTEPTSMSFSVQHVPSGLEFAGTGFRGLFAQPINLFRPRHWLLLKEIHRFNTSCAEVLERDDSSRLSLGDYLKLRGYSDDFRDHYLIPMSSAVWSTSPASMLDFPASTLVRFFKNHRFLSLHGQLAWRTVRGGSRVYRDLLIRPYRENIRVGNAAKAVFESDGQVAVQDSLGKEVYDSAILACHGDEAFALLARPSTLQEKVLPHFKYQTNSAVLHTDERVMPKSRTAWASWNYRTETGGSSTIYWMNSLQNVSKRRYYFVSINDPGNIGREHVLRTFSYDHPVYNSETISAQNLLPALNEEGRILFCGSYFKYGFHEDALASGEMAAAVWKRRFGGSNP